MNRDEINNDRELITALHTTSIRSRNVEVLAMLLGTVNGVVDKYEQELKDNPTGALSSVRVASKYFKLVQSQIERRINTLQKAYESRNNSARLKRNYERDLELLRRTVLERKIGKLSEPVTKAITNPILEQLTEAGYDPLASREVRNEQAKKIVATNAPTVPDGEEFMKAFELYETEKKDE
jgi:hypothetical protein